MESPLFITITGNKSGAKVRLNINNITKYREHENGGTSFFTYKDDGVPYMVAKEKINEVDQIIESAIKQHSHFSQPEPYTLKP